MTIAEAIYRHSLELSPQSAQEALDFIEFLKQRESKNWPPGQSFDDTEAFLAALSGGLSEDFPDDIDDNDLGVDAPREELD